MLFVETNTLGEKGAHKAGSSAKQACDKCKNQGKEIVDDHKKASD